MGPLFRDRSDAGHQLAVHVEPYANQPNVLVLGLPRGGVIVAYEIAKHLHAPLDVFIVRKLGMPGRAELALGAIASGGVRVLNHELIRALELSGEDIERVTRHEKKELKRREKLYRAGRMPKDPAGKDVILVDDGLATGATMHAAAIALREKKCARLTVAVPVAAPQTCSEFEGKADRIFCLYTPDPFFSVGSWYENFEQTTDREVQELLFRAQSNQRRLHPA